MTAIISKYPRKKGVNVRLTGEITGMMIIKASRDVYDLIPLNEQDFQIWDYTDATDFKISEKEIILIADLDKEFIRKRSKPLIIVSVQTTEPGNKLGEIYEDHIKNPKVKRVHFNSRKDAEKWITLHFPE